MFLEKLMDMKLGFILQSVSLMKEGLIEPDSYVIDVNQFLENAKAIKAAADQKNIRLFFMLKQVGRNPYLAKKLVELGYDGAVVVDYREAKLMMQHGIPICNVGHLVQVPTVLLKPLLHYGCEYFTVYSFEKLEMINTICEELNIIQKVMVKVFENGNTLYSGQEGGIALEDLVTFVEKAKKLKNIRISGATAFPCFLSDENKIYETSNYATVLKATKLFQDNDLVVDIINLPSCSGVDVIHQLDENLQHVVLEPGHALSGTIPFHQYNESIELPCVLYLSEVSHQFNDKSYCYGGGFYRRGHLKNALVFKDYYYEATKVTTVDNDSIDYYFMLDHHYPIGSPVVMAFRFQMFVNRSNVVLLEDDKIIGTYNGLGDCYG